jgi:hypothetical protein
MHQTAPVTAMACAHCGGFTVVHITTGKHLPDGSRETTPAVCPACHGQPPHTARGSASGLPMGVA